MNELRQCKDHRTATTIFIIILAQAISVSLIYFGYHLAQAGNTRAMASRMVESGCIPSMPAHDLKD